jgi:hypothetical protein
VLIGCSVLVWRVLREWRLLGAWFVADRAQSLSACAAANAGARDARQDGMREDDADQSWMSVARTSTTARAAVRQPAGFAWV